MVTTIRTRPLIKLSHSSHALADILFLGTPFLMMEVPCSMLVCYGGFPEEIIFLSLKLYSNDRFFISCSFTVNKVDICNVDQVGGIHFSIVYFDMKFMSVIIRRSKIQYTEQKYCMKKISPEKCDCFGWRVI